ncbi:hypothetical protein Trydic_g16775 [Trypoxylus dichotomus]
MASDLLILHYRLRYKTHKRINPQIAENHSPLLARNQEKRKTDPVKRQLEEGFDEIQLKDSNDSDLNDDAMLYADSTMLYANSTMLYAGSTMVFYNKSIVPIRHNTKEKEILSNEGKNSPP